MAFKYSNQQILIHIFCLPSTFSSAQSLSRVHLFTIRGLQHTRPPCPLPTPGVYSNSCPLSRWCHPTISSSVVPFSTHLQSFPASGSFQMSQLFAPGGQNIGLQHQSLQWIFWTDFLSDGLVGSLCSPRDSQESSPTPQFKSINSSALSFFYSPTHMHTWPLEKL